ncbi:MAG: MBL fold metallo-hydrolase [Thermodesulfobacteriota bacterium]|nr:MBL fold metallo-hydrolase [Thermodesulfobacteriota bacterium]
MKRRLFPLLFLVGLVILFLGQVKAACRNPNIAENEGPYLRTAPHPGVVEIKWFGHAFFQITSSNGTKIITDPFGAMGFPMPDVWPHVVTVGRESGNHNNVGLAKGSPLVLRGVKPGMEDWNQINTVFRDVLIYNVPIHQRGALGYLKGSGFVFELDGLCVFHTGDVGEPFNEDQLQLIGHVDIVLLPIGGSYTMGPENAKKVVEQLKPKIAVPMHYYNNMSLVEIFIDGHYKARFLNTNTFTFSQGTLPSQTEIFILKVLWGSDVM